MSTSEHKDISLGLYLFCIILIGNQWNMKIWESCEALIPYKPVLTVSQEVTY